MWKQFHLALDSGIQTWLMWPRRRAQSTRGYSQQQQGCAGPGMEFTGRIIKQKKPKSWSHLFQQQSIFCWVSLAMYNLKMNVIDSHVLEKASPTFSQWGLPAHPPKVCVKVFPISGDDPEGCISRLSKRDLLSVADRGEEHQSLLKNWFFLPLKKLLQYCSKNRALL